MSKYSEFFLSSKSTIVQLETIEVSHSDFTSTYRIVRNAVNGITATLESGEEVFFKYYPLRITGLGVRDNLDFGIRVDLGDLGDIIPTELDRLIANDNLGEKPKVVYRTYRSDDLTSLLYGPIALEVKSFALNKYGASFEAKAPTLNSFSTGELYTIDRFPTLRGFI